MTVRVISTLTVLIVCLAGRVAQAQEVLTVIRFVTVREGGPVPAGETTAYEATDPKAVAWAQIAVSGQAHTIVFRWLDPQRRLQRVSPSRIVAPGEEFVWDELPIRGRPPADLPGVWTVEFYVNERLAAGARFAILPHRRAPTTSVRHQTTLSMRSQETETGWGTHTRSIINSLDHMVQFTIRLRPDTNVVASISGGTLWGTSSGVRSSGIVAYNAGGRFFAQAGLEGSWITNFLESPPRRIDTSAAFFDLRYNPPRRPTFSLSYRRDTAADDRIPRITDSTTTTWTLSSSYFRGRFAFNGTYIIQDVDDGTTTNLDVATRTLTLTGTYFPSPRLFIFATRTTVKQDFGPTPFSPAFGQQTNTTSARLNYQLSPRFQLAAFLFDTDMARTDGVFSMATSQRGMEGSYQLNSRLRLNALTQWQRQTTTFGGLATTSEQRLSRYGVDVFLPRNLTIGAAFSPQTTTTGPSVTRANVWTTYVNFFPSPKFFLGGTYSLTRTTGPGTDTTNATWALSARYVPTPWVEYQATAQLTDAKFPLFPLANSHTLTYQLTGVFRF
jgi:hypothetical protein